MRANGRLQAMLSGAERRLPIREVVEAEGVEPPSEDQATLASTSVGGEFSRGGLVSVSFHPTSPGCFLSVHLRAGVGRNNRICFSPRRDLPIRARTETDSRSYLALLAVIRQRARAVCCCYWHLLFFAHFYETRRLDSHLTPPQIPVETNCAPTKSRDNISIPH